MVECLPLACAQSFLALSLPEWRHIAATDSDQPEPGHRQLLAEGRVEVAESDSPTLAPLDL